MEKTMTSEALRQELAKFTKETGALVLTIAYNPLTGSMEIGGTMPPPMVKQILEASLFAYAATKEGFGGEPCEN